MCLEQASIEKAIFYYNDKEKRIIVMKNFDIYNYKLYSSIKGFTYKFTLNKDKSLLVSKSNRKQNVLLSIKTFSNIYCNKIKSKILGYHCLLFDKYMNLALSDWEIYDFIRIPIVVNIDDVQEINNDEIVVERFMIMNPLEFEKNLSELLEHSKCFYKEKQIKDNNKIIELYTEIYNNILKNNVR